jgi:hypothetical protein
MAALNMDHVSFSIARRRAEGAIQSILARTPSSMRSAPLRMTRTVAANSNANSSLREIINEMTSTFVWLHTRAHQRQLYSHRHFEQDLNAMVLRSCRYCIGCRSDDLTDVTQLSSSPVSYRDEGSAGRDIRSGNCIACLELGRALPCRF